MIITEKIKVKVTPRTKNYYKELGYEFKINEFIEISVSHLTNSSQYYIEVECDKCKSRINCRYDSYYKTIKKNDGLYYCEKCNNIFRKKTMLEKYGNENYNNQEKIKQTNIERYGVDSYAKTNEYKIKSKKNMLKKYGNENYNNQEKIKQTKLKKYGNENYNNQEKYKETCLKRYGAEYPLSLDKIKEKSKNTLIKNYGVDVPMKSEIIKKRIKQTNIERYGKEYWIQNEENKKIMIRNHRKSWKENILNKYKNDSIIDIDENNDYIFKCDKDHIFKISSHIFYLRKKYKTKICTICNPIDNHNSGMEILFGIFIKENYNDEILINNRKIINPLELDIYLPDLKLAFEFNGLYFHNEMNKPKNYHLNKTEECEKQGIKLIHIYEDDWVYKQDIVKSRILNLLGKSNKIYARKCQIKEVSSKESKLFLNQNHIQGNVNAKYNIGLYYENELVSLMTFGKKRKFMNSSSSEGEYEMLRFCSKLNYNIIGGSSKLFNYFVKTYHPVEITTYADRSWSKGDLYKQLGFKYVDKTSPNYHYIVDGIRKHRFGFRKDILVKEGFDVKKTEHQIMIDREIYRIYDSGHLKFIWKNS